MAAYIKEMKDANGNALYPITKAEAVYMADGKTTVEAQIASMKSNFQAGVDGIYSAIVAQGTTPASKSQGDVKAAIATMATAKYNAGNAAVTVSASASGRTVTAKASNGKTASASVALAGSNGVVSVATAGGSGNQTFDIGDGWATQIVVDRTGAYNAGKSAGYSEGSSLSAIGKRVKSGSTSDHPENDTLPKGKELWKTLFLVPTRNVNSGWSWIDIGSVKYDPNTGKLSNTSGVHNLNYYYID